MFIHMQMAKEKQNLLLVTFEKKMDKARFECYLLNYKEKKKELCLFLVILFQGSYVLSLMKIKRMLRKHTNLSHKLHHKTRPNFTKP